MGDFRKLLLAPRPQMWTLRPRKERDGTVCGGQVDWELPFLMTPGELRRAAFPGEAEAKDRAIPCSSCWLLQKGNPLMAQGAAGG